MDVSAKDGRDPYDDFVSINKELREFNAELASRPQIVVANKCDDATDEEVEMFVSSVREDGYEDVFVISAAARLGLKELTDKITEMVTKLPPVVIHDVAGEDEIVYKYEEERKFDIVVSDGVYEVTGKWIDVVLNSTNFDSTDSMAYFQRTLISSGVIDALKAKGIKEGDTVKIGELEFDYYE